MVVQVSQSDLVSVFRCCYLLQIEVNGVVIRQIYQQLRQPGVLQDGWQVLVSSHQLSHELGPELRPRDLIQIGDMHKGDTSMHEDLPVVDQIESILEWNFDELISCKLLADRQDLGVEPDLISKLDPHIVFIIELLVVHITLVSEDLKDIMGLIRGKSMVKKPGLLRCEPFSELVVSAVSESADEMGDLVVGHRFL